MRGDEVIARKRSPPIALAARDKYDLALFVGEPIEHLLDCEIGAPLSLASARVGKHVAHHSSPVGSCGCAQDRRSTASRACTIAATKLATSGWLMSSKAKFGVMDDAIPWFCRRSGGSLSSARYLANV